MAVEERTRTITVHATDRPAWLDLPSLWRYRDFLGFQVRQAFLVRYRQSVLGIGWAIARPVVTTLVFTLLLGQMAGVDAEGFPYAVYAFLGITGFQLFSSAVSRSCTSVLAGAHLCAQVWFPRVVLPLASLVVALVDYAIALVPLGILMAWLGVAPAATVWLVLPLAFVTAVVGGGIGMGLGALNVFRRDVGFLVPYLLQVAMFATPALYPAEVVPEGWRVLYGLNPAAGLVQAHRAVVLGTPVDGELLALSLGSGLVWAVLGTLVFTRLQRRFVDHA